MTSLFSETGAQRFDEIAVPGLLCAFDFDGTLAPIVSVPDQARLPTEIRERLIALRRYAPVAIITGRSVQDIRDRLGFEPDFIVGNHGLEGVPGWEQFADRHEALCSAWRRQLDEALRDSAYGAGVQLEDKRYSLSLHYRQAPDAELAMRRLAALCRRLRPRPRVIAGKYVFNLAAEDACNKGSALGQMIAVSGARHAIYVGDDITDEDVFRLLRGDVLSIRIEYAADSAAHFFLPGLRDMMALLDRLIERLRLLGASNWMLAETVGADGA